jgi:hypothetical protein
MDPFQPLYDSKNLLEKTGVAMIPNSPDGSLDPPGPVEN